MRNNFKSIKNKEIIKKQEKMVLITKEDLSTEASTINHVKALAYDRSAASIGETRTINYIQNELNDNNINSRVEYFSWSTPIRYLMKTIYLMIFVYLIVYRLFLIIVFFYFVKYLFQKTRRISFVSREQSKNLFTKIPSKKKVPNQPIIIFSAHYDSISSRIPYKMQRVIMIVMKIIIIPYMGLCIFISLWLILNIIAITSFNAFLLYLVSVCSLTTISVIIPMFLFLFTSNKSTGSIDNASGVSILIELAKNVKENPLNNYDVLFLWSGAEEWGLKGSKKFVDKYAKNYNIIYDLSKSININIDMVGSYIGLLDKSGLLFKKALNENLNQLIEASAEELNISITLYDKLIKPKSDYISFKKLARKKNKSFQTALFHSDKDSIYIHSKKDTPDRCSNILLDDCLKICYNTIKNLDGQLS
ncbi:MAG: M28 family peptidase [Candidatus Lokiarchaeota archaeon]|nr:M28 family peptidase [Candidatus Lokiarchaeota archaeon]